MPDGGGRLPVVFRVQEGPRRDGRPACASTRRSRCRRAARPRELRLRAGVPYRVRDLARDRTSLLSAYRDGGYPEADVVPEVVALARTAARRRSCCT